MAYFLEMTVYEEFGIGKVYSFFLKNLETCQTIGDHKVSTFGTTTSKDFPRSLLPKIWILANKQFDM